MTPMTRLMCRIEGWCDRRLVWLAEHGLIGCFHAHGRPPTNGLVRQVVHYLLTFSLCPTTVRARRTHWSAA